MDQCLAGVGWGAAGQRRLTKCHSQTESRWSTLPGRGADHLGCPMSTPLPAHSTWGFVSAPWPRQVSSSSAVSGWSMQIHALCICIHAGRPCRTHPPGPGLQHGKAQFHPGPCSYCSRAARGWSRPAPPSPFSGQAPLWMPHGLSPWRPLPPTPSYSHPRAVTFFSPPLIFLASRSPP